MRQFVSEYALDFSGHPKTRFALEMHRISEAVAEAFAANGRTPVELTFEGEALAEARIMGDTAHFHPETIEEVADLPHSSSLTPLAADPVTPLVLEDDPEGRSRVGGRAPEGLVMPEAGFASGYHFVGELDLAHVGGEGIVPLIYPLFVDYHPPVFLDVADPLRPSVFPIREGKIFNLAKPHRTFTTDAVPYGPIREDDEIIRLFAEGGTVEFMEYRGTFRPSDPGLPEGQVVAGIPGWLQNPELPLCPKTGEPMRFAAQIAGGQPVTRSDVDAGGSVYEDWFREMTFWGSGLMYVFANPVAGTLCLHIQDT